MKNQSIRIGGKFVAFWPESIIPAYGSQIVKSAFAISDPERLDSAAGIVNYYMTQAHQINQDRDLSDYGKSERRKDAAKNQLYKLKTHADKVKALENQHQQAIKALVRIKPADASEAVIDLAMVEKFKADGKVAGLVAEFGSQRMREALARTPIELSGLDEASHEKMLLSLADAGMVAEVLEDGEALRVARHVVQKAIDELQDTAQATAGELASWFGTGWKLAGVVDTLMRLKLDAMKQAENA